MIVQGHTIEKHNNRLREVLTKLREKGIRVQKTKCKFLQTQVNYLGHKIDSQGIHPTDEHKTAIKNLKTPSNVSELRAFLGSINYYGRFVPHLQTICAPLHRLTKKNVKWVWTKTDDQIVDKLKNCLISSKTLVHFDENLPLVLSCDASEVGLGAVLFHVFPDKSERPIAYASRKLSDAETKYSTIEKEALAIIFGLSKFNDYLFGKKFVIKTDHRPLEFILGPNRCIPKTTANRIARWALLLSAYIYEIQYTKGKNNSPADVLSRLPQEITEASEEEKLGDLHCGHLFHLRFPDLVVSKKSLQKNTITDKILSQVIKFIQLGWPISKHEIKKDLWTYFEKKDELSFEEGTLLWMGRIVVPQDLQDGFLHLLHEGHPGITSMKSSAKFYVWWPNIDQNIENFVKNCVPCQKARPNEMTCPLFSWPSSGKPWMRIHVDYAGPFLGQYWLIVVDAHSKWLEVMPTNKTTASKTIMMLRDIFSRFGIPASLVSDNGPQFTATDFEKFCLENGIKHIKSTPYHPKTNGLAERFVRTFKDKMKTAKNAGTNSIVALQQFLMSYRNTINRATGRTPSEILLGRRLTTRLDLLKPDIARNQDREIINQKYFHDNKAKAREFSDGEKVWVMRGDGSAYEEGSVIRRTGEVSYRVMINGVEVKKHADHMRRRSEPPSFPERGDM